jgi:HK97 gp10 family phage protein
VGQVRIQVAATIELEDLDELPDQQSEALEEEVHNIVETAADNMVSYAQGIVPVRTGNLLASIFSEIDEDDLSVTLGATADYASFIEYGTVKMRAQPFLEPAAAIGQEEMNARIEETIVQRLDGQLTSDEEGEDITMEMEGVTLANTGTE